MYVCMCNTYVDGSGQEAFYKGAVAHVQKTQVHYTCEFACVCAGILYVEEKERACPKESLCNTCLRVNPCVCV